MNNYILFNKFIILIYCIVSYIEGKGYRAAVIVALLVIYVTINVAIYMIDSEPIKLVVVIISIVLCIHLSYYTSCVFILLLIPNLLELSALYFKSVFYYILFLLIPAFTLEPVILKNYILIASLSCIIIYICLRTENRFRDMNKQIDALRQEKDKLRKLTIIEEEYKGQLIYAKQLEERNIIAQEIHDSLGHAITGSVMQLEAVKLLLDKDKDKALEILQSAIESLRNGMDNIRFTLRNIKPPTEQIGINKLKLFIDEFKRKSTFDIKLTYGGDINKISTEQWNCIYDNAVEALTNAVKYSKALSMVISIEVLNKILKVEYRDNGLGALTIKKGLGLQGMEYRCASLKGKFIVDGSRGFSIIMLLPVENN
ncbi:histidine kinase [Clostridium thermarum]|uniref:histidine kinase n=1 Tax=Clostridium thermarum TaxID=1716543 RepID=UPI0013D85B98|nr:histidine kinase [Clostridium thermarum]